MFWKRASVISIAVLALLLVAALANATVGSDDSSTSSATSTTLVTTVTESAPAAEGSVVYEAGAAGTVEVSAIEPGSLSIGTVDPADGWAYEIEMASGREVEVKFLDGGQWIDFQAELEDGQVNTRVRNRPLEVRDDGRSQDFTQAASGEVATFDAAGAGTVEIRRTDSGLELVNATAAAGWDVAKTEITAVEIEVEFRSGATELEFKAELEDGMIRTRIETELNNADDSVGDDSVGEDSADARSGSNRGSGSDDDDSSDDDHDDQSDDDSDDDGTSG